MDAVDVPEQKKTNWTLELNKYQRDNLLWLLCDLLGHGYYEPPTPRDLIEPFPQANTGDWVGEIANQLVIPNEKPEDRKPNMSRSAMKLKIADWWKVYWKTPKSIRLWPFITRCPGCGRVVSQRY